MTGERLVGIRIISGKLRGKKLQSVQGMAVRPTADRIRESVFNILSSRISGAVVLDLFAGTGAFGMEALSRGAASALFIENQRDANAVIAKNIRSCALEGVAQLIKWDIRNNLNCIRRFRPAFTLVFMDPPYGKNLIQPALRNLHTSCCMEKRACVVVEHASSEPISEDCPEYAVTDQRKYGKTLVSFLDYVL